MPTVTTPAPITWTNVRVPLSELDPWEHNPRQIRKDQAERLVESFSDFGQAEPILAGPKAENGKYPLYNGHQRYGVLKREHGLTFIVDARISSRPLTETERQKLTIYLHQGTTGEWNFDSLSGWDAPSLVTWGMDAAALKAKKLEAAALDTLLKFEEDADPANYTRKIKAPIYQPQADQPDLATLTDTTRAQALLVAIDDATFLPEDEKAFLRLAAMRHVVFNYQRIADYYAHASPALQRLMEDSALVIIDFNRAIELGFVNLSETIARQYMEDYGEAE